MILMNDKNLKPSNPIRDRVRSLLFAECSGSFGRGNRVFVDGLEVEPFLDKLITLLGGASFELPFWMRYTYSVVWSEEDREYVATVAEMPSLSWLDESMPVALARLTQLVQATVQDLAGGGEPIPEPKI